MDFVLDASIALSWCFKDEQTPATQKLLDELGNSTAFVPGIWPLEIGNIMLGACRKQRITYASATEFLSLLSDLNIEVDHSTASLSFHDIFILAHTHKLTTYDAAYLELSLRLGLPLATKDHQLALAASGLGVKIIS